MIKIVNKDSGHTIERIYDNDGVYDFWLDGNKLYTHDEYGNVIWFSRDMYIAVRDVYVQTPILHK